MKFILATLMIVLISSLLSSCVTLNPVKRQPLIISPINQAFPVSDRTAIVYFSSRVESYPLNETIWDNVSGAIWDPIESKQIGYTQDYQFSPFAHPHGTTAVISNVDTRIVIPFGRVLSETITSGLDRSFDRLHISFSEETTSKLIEAESPDLLLTVTVEEFKVWEKPLNKLNMKAVINTELKDLGSKQQTLVTHEYSEEILKHDLESGFCTSSDFINEMNKLTNDFAKRLAVQIINDAIAQ